MTDVRTRWRDFRHGVSQRWDRLPKASRIGIVLVFVVFLYALPNKGFYEYLGLPLGEYIPLYTTRNDMATVLFQCGYYILLGLGLNIVVGYAGLLDLGFFGFFAVGAYTVATLTSPQSKIFTEYNWLESPWPWLAALPLAIALSFAAGVILGFPVLRLRGDYLAIVTLGFAEMIRIVAQQNDWIFNGDRGIPNIGRPPGNNADGSPIFQFDAKPYYWLILTVIIGMVFLIRNLVRSRVGRAWIAIREDEDAAELMGVPTYKFKIWAFAMGAGIGGFSGALWAGQIGFVNASTFKLEQSILVLAAVLLGGAGNIFGAILGGFLVIYVPEWLRSVGDVFGLPEQVRIAGEPYDISATNLRYLFFGIILIVVMIFRPQGLWPNRRRAAELKDREKEAMVGA
ncbi:branched-chain amino acid transport system permease protein [Asanoa hainanensis]|uniref:Branched-chain amino acid transport system permease protein n=1 Tax=Asanoa hainanensis TaxID=560556 RepID=A0A239PI64_9ACTN|nr:branched-chain amino acid ABC transporter permease [Asanoa hainanensis]SNT66304.1 branched-chain amino acid transport system permease protein [Asanoa hainanensis]